MKKVSTKVASQVPALAVKYVDAFKEVIVNYGDESIAAYTAINKEIKSINKNVLLSIAGDNHVASALITMIVKNDGMYKLHYGERVLTKAENSQYSQGGVSSSPSINISINAVQELGNEIKRAIQPIVETTIKNYQAKQLMKLGIAGGQ
jgi:hypothetical protein